MDPFSVKAWLVHKHVELYRDYRELLKKDKVNLSEKLMIIFFNLMYVFIYIIICNIYYQQITQFFN